MSSGSDERVAPAAVALLTTAVVILTAHFLGAAWLGRSILGLPLGLWLIAGVFAAWRRGWLELADAALPFAAKPPSLELSQVTHHRLAPFIRCWIAARSPLVRFGHAVSSADALPSVGLLAEGLAEDLDKRPDLAEPIEITMIATRAEAEAIRDLKPAVPVRWRLIERMDARAQLSSDLVFLAHTDCGGLATLPEHERRPATWFDWSTPRPLSFASVFPHQNDPAQLSIGVLPTADEPNPLIGALLVAAAVKGRTHSRLSILDRLRGRIPLDGLGAPGIIDPGAPCVLAMRRVSDLLGTTDPARATTIERTAASVLCSWLVTPSARIEMDERRSMMERCCAYLPDRPEAWLRLGAVRIAAHDDAAGLDAIMHADPFVRASRDQLLFDQAEFIQSELEHGNASSMVLGRVAAGYCLLAAQHDYERLEFLRDDLLEELDHAGWLLGRDQDTAMLRGVFEELHRVRRAESRGLPAANPHPKGTRRAA